MQDKVKSTLTKYKNTRDCDPYLLYYIWESELKDINYDYSLNIDNIPLTTFLRLWKDKVISHPSTIMRARRKVQEKHSETRGKVWEKRHEKQKDVQKQLGYGVQMDNFSKKKDMLTLGNLSTLLLVKGYNEKVSNQWFYKKGFKSI